LQSRWGTTKPLVWGSFSSDAVFRVLASAGRFLLRGDWPRWRRHRVPQGVNRSVIVGERSAGVASDG